METKVNELEVIEMSDEQKGMLHGFNSAIGIISKYIDEFEKVELDEKEMLTKRSMAEQRKKGALIVKTQLVKEKEKWEELFSARTNSES